MKEREGAMAQAIEEVQLRQAAFRSCATGAVVVTGPCHDITRLPGGLDADLDEWHVLTGKGNSSFEALKQSIKG
jgi:hypothetical protein